MQNLKESQNPAAPKPQRPLTTNNSEFLLSIAANPPLSNPPKFRSCAFCAFLRRNPPAPLICGSSFSKFFHPRSSILACCPLCALREKNWVFDFGRFSSVFGRFLFFARFLAAQPVPLQHSPFKTHPLKLFLTLDSFCPTSPATLKPKNSKFMNFNPAPQTERNT